MGSALRRDDLPVPRTWAAFGRFPFVQLVCRSGSLRLRTAGVVASGWR